jgi:hypothetical protein
VPFPYQELSRQEQYRERIGEELMRTALQVQSIVYPQYYPY